jgi:hypothetical protein
MRDAWSNLRVRQLGAILIIAASCTRGAPPADGVAEAGQDAGGVTRDAGSVPAADAGLAFQVLLWTSLDGGGLTPVALGVRSAPIDPVSRLVVEVRPAPADARLRLLDGSDQVVESNDVLAAFDGGLRYELGLLEPLRPGRSYTLLLDAELAAGLEDARGRPLEDVRLGLLVRGESPSVPAPAKRPRRPR